MMALRHVPAALLVVATRGKRILAALTPPSSVHMPSECSLGDYLGVIIRNIIKFMTFSGHLAERTNLRYFLTAGMLGNEIHCGVFCVSDEITQGVRSCR
jgi:hypothetical protein